MNKAFALILSVAVALSATAEDFNLNEVVVTGTRAPRLLKDTPVQTVVITSKDIEKADATDISDLLQQELPGIEFSYAMNQQTHLNFGGFGGQSILFLIDGERLAGETMDDVDFSRMDMNNVERIEIVRGASSALYGSNAGGGVINIITRKASRPILVAASARIGKHSDQRYNLTVSNKGRLFDNSLMASYSHLSNYDVESEPEAATRVISTVYGHRTWNFKDRLSYSPSERLKLTARAGYFFRQLTRVADVPERYRDYSAGLGGEWKISDDDHINISYSFDQYDKSDLRRLSRFDVRSYSNVQNSVRSVYNHYFSRGDILTAGADYMHDYLMNTRLTGKSRRQINADAFVQYDCIISEKLEVVGALRYDYFSDGKLSRLTPKLSGRYRPRRNLNLRAAWGMGFRAPTLKEKYYDFDMAGIWIVKGNPELKPELSHNLNISGEYTQRNFNYTLTAYYNYVHDRISTGLPYTLPEENSQLYLDYINLDKFSVYGLEATVKAAWNNGLSAKLSYAYTHENSGRNKDGKDANNQYLPARPHSLTARADWHKNLSPRLAMNLGLNGRFLSAVNNPEYKDYYDLSAGTVKVHYPEYTLWRFSASLDLDSRFKINLALDNLLNYKPKYYYLNAPLTDGISLMAGVSINLF